MRMSQNVRYLFLDFDGVTHRVFPVEGEDDESNAHFAFVPNIVRALEGMPFVVKVVISSTWRRTHPLDKLRNFLGDLGHMVVGSTPVHSDGNREGGRLAEVRQWIADNDPGAIWVALDDYPEMYAKGPGDDEVVALVKCPDCFSEREGEMLRQAISDPRKWSEGHPVPHL